MVVGFNESTLLKPCLESINFCEEILYIDLGSTDDSLAVASQYTNHLITLDKEDIPSGEIAQSRCYHLVKHNWVLVIDPDECVDISLREELLTTFDDYRNQPLIGAISVPWQFYFIGHKLKGTPWGGNNWKYLLVNKNGFDILPITHYGRKVKQGFTNHIIPLNNQQSNVLHHYWVSSIYSFFAKHRRYLKKEGRDRFNMGNRTTLRKLIREPYHQFKFAFYTKRGFTDGWVGFFLSLFWSWYQTRAQIALYRYTREHQKNA